MKLLDKIAEYIWYKAIKFQKLVLFVDEKTANTRMKICLDCDGLNKKTHQCKYCGCSMNIKTKLRSAFCPNGQWYNINTIPKSK